MTKPKTDRTKTGRTLSMEDVDAIADDVALEDYDVEALKTRRRGRASIGAGPPVVRSVIVCPMVTSPHRGRCCSCACAHRTARVVIGRRAQLKPLRE
jgi:hypothetical protein